MTITLDLDPDAYSECLTQMRVADKQGGTFDVMFTDGQANAQYFYNSPNFELAAYKLNGGVKRTLTKYNHVSGVPSCSRTHFRTALLAGGGTGTVVEANLSRVIALTSEAARSAVVERNILRALKYERNFDFAAHELLFKNYGNTTDHMGFGGTGQGYQPGWEPLAKWHYASFFDQSEGSREQQRARVGEILAL